MAWTDLTDATYPLSQSVDRMSHMNTTKVGNREDPVDPQCLGL